MTRLSAPAPSFAAPAMAWAMLFSLLAGLALMPGVKATGDDEATAANNPDSAIAFIEELSNNAINVWTNTDLTENERQSEFRRLLQEGFDVDYISKLVLGRHRRTASRAELREYTSLFPDYIVNIFARRIGDYGDERFEVVGTAPAGRRDLFVRSQIVRPNAAPIAADWRVRQVGENLRIVDLKVEGISMALTQRDEFSAKIDDVGMQGLLEDLRDGRGDIPGLAQKAE